MSLEKTIEAVNAALAGFVATKTALNEKPYKSTLFGLTFQTVKDGELLNISEETREAIEPNDLDGTTVFYRATGAGYDVEKGRGSEDQYTKGETVVMVVLSDLPGIKHLVENALMLGPGVRILNADFEGEKVHAANFRQGEYDYRKQLFSFTFTVRARVKSPALSKPC